MHASIRPLRNAHNPRVSKFNFNRVAQTMFQNDAHLRTAAVVSPLSFTRVVVVTFVWIESLIANTILIRCINSNDEVAASVLYTYIYNELMKIELLSATPKRLYTVNLIWQNVLAITRRRLNRRDFLTERMRDWYLV